MFYTVSFPPKVSSSVSEVLLDSASGSLPRWFRGTSEQVTLIVFFPCREVVPISEAK